MAMENGFKFKLLFFIAKITRIFHPPGTERFLRLIWDPDMAKGFDTIIPYDKTLKININISFFIEWFIFFKGFYEKSLVETVKKFFLKDGVFVDVGANIGCVSLIAAKTAKQVIAIEPIPWIAERLQNNFNLNNLTNIKIVQCVASDKKGRASFYCPSGDKIHGGMGSLYKDHSRGEKIEVETKTLDEILGDTKVDFIKIDTEGHDKNVIMGAKEIIKKNKPFIVYEYAEDSEGFSEISQKEVSSFLRELGYEFKWIDTINMFCIPPRQNLST